MFIALLTLLSALSISGVAIFYSVIGLATIFPGAFVPVIIMGSVLEIGKLITASWLYRHWQQCRFLLKTYLTTAVVVLSLITSMGIFGFLSKAHLEQNLASKSLTQRIEIVNNKIVSQEVYIKRQHAVIERSEKSLTRTSGSNSENIEIEKQNLKDAQDKLKTLLVVETNTIKNLNNRLSILDADVNTLRDKKGLFSGGNHKKAMRLKEAQAPERDLINNKIKEAQNRIDVLKEEYKQETNLIQAKIDKLRTGSSDNKNDINVAINTAEDNIINAQDNIDDLIIEREPLETKMIKLEAEVGPIKYIAALVVDWGVAEDVDLNEAVRWVILIIISVFDPLAVALLLAANQSLMRRFPVEPLPPPPELTDFEKPEPYEPPVERVKDKADDWNEMVTKANALAEKEKAESIQQEWSKKLEAFNKKVPKVKDKPVEFIQEEEETIPHIDLISQKKTKDKEIVADKEPSTSELLAEGFAKEQKARKKEEQEAKFEQRIKDEEAELERISKEAEEEEVMEEGIPNYIEPPISEQIEEIMEPERTRPDFTEVIESEKAVAGNLGAVVVDKGKVIEKQPAKAPKIEETKPDLTPMTDFERTGMLNKLHQEHGKYEDISDEELKKERDAGNKEQFLADVSLTEEEARNHPSMTESRRAFFQDQIDDIVRGDITSENVPPDIAKTLALLMTDEYPDPDIITKGSALKEEHPEGIEKMNAEGLKEKFMIKPKTEDRPITDDELDKLLEGWDEEQKPTVRQKTKELELPEPEKNEIILPELKNTVDEVPEIVEKINIENIIPKEKFTNYRKRLTTDVDYHKRVEQRINDLITKLENSEAKLNDLTDEDQKVILDILNQ
jgi:hypothetical protein|tara:strand:- start:89 stop:2626 length:2538 start_codon:yes stop_codon:yes gene_type:complete